MKTRDLINLISPDDSISVRKQCELIGLNRSSIYYEHAKETEENLQIMRLMDEHYLLYPTHGVLQIQDHLRGQQIYVNHKKIRRLMRKMGLEAIYPKRNLSKLGNVKYIHSYLLKGLTIKNPNHVWAIDITYIPMSRGFMYLIAIIDIYSRFVVAWDVFNSLDSENTLIVLKSAIERYGKPEIINSDQGSQFTCSLWIDYLTSEDIKISMDGKGRAIDNIFIERLWRTVKQDYVYLHPASNGQELFWGLCDFFEYYNTKKCHQGIDRVTPLERYQQVA